MLQTVFLSRKAIFALTFTCVSLFCYEIYAQNNATGDAAAVVAPEAARKAEEELRDVQRTLEAESAANAEATKTAEPPVEETEKTPTLLELIRSGGWMMYPIGFMSLLVVAVGLERFVALHLRFIAPGFFFRRLNEFSVEKADPRKIYTFCRQHPSATARVVSAALTRVGRPMLEVQTALQEAKDNEAQRMFGNVRILILAASITPLMGLLGTVIGMIKAFMVTASLSMATTMGINRASQLSVGIYEALITTCAGLIVAIPAAILAHWYEGRIQRIFRSVDKKLLYFMNYMTEVEGKVHVTPEQYETYYQAARRSASGMPGFSSEPVEKASRQNAEATKKPSAGGK